LEVRSSLTHNRIARVLLCIHQGQIVLLHGFIKKTQQTPENDLDLAAKRQNEVDDEPVEFVRSLNPEGCLPPQTLGSQASGKSVLGPITNALRNPSSSTMSEIPLARRTSQLPGVSKSRSLHPRM
jgi:hypothetical protein